MRNEHKIWFISFVGLAVLVLTLLGRTYRGFERPPTAAVLGAPSAWESPQWFNNDHSQLEQPTILKADKALPLVVGESIESNLQQPSVRLIDTQAHQVEYTSMYSERDRARRPFMPLGFLRDDLPLVPPEIPVPQP